mmetsp:Transcript_105438/g.340072  ORF Transcript_105438/g.340072 Transcript_105438/m.340072 type:complete len:208 (+) Transcript_105438:429-1052(+)
MRSINASTLAWLLTSRTPLTLHTLQTAFWTSLRGRLACAATSWIVRPMPCRALAARTQALTSLLSRRPFEGNPATRWQCRTSKASAGSRTVSCNRTAELINAIASLHRWMRCKRWVSEIITARLYARSLPDALTLSSSGLYAGGCFTMPPGALQWRSLSSPLKERTVPHAAHTSSPSTPCDIAVEPHCSHAFAPCANCTAGCITRDL